jgi:hypothetical protein
MPTEEPSGQVLKKIYFIKKAAEGEELVTLLKNKFKTIDAIRDVLGWYREGREFEVSLVGWSDAEPPAADGELTFEITRVSTPGEANRKVLGAIGHILSWLDKEKPFDIALIQRDGAAGGYCLPGMSLN